MSSPVISAWTAISPYGYGRDAFAAGVRARRSPVSDVDGGSPAPLGGIVPGFEPREYFGPKKTRAMNRVSGLTVAAAGQLLADIGVAPGAGSEDIGFVLGTTTGSVQSMMDLTRASITGDRPDHVEPAAVPGCVMNCAAGQAAIWHGLKGPNATIAAGRTTGLQALNYARRLLMSERAGKVLCGAAEEHSGARSWLEHHRRGGDAATLGEGCAMFLLEPAAGAGTALATLAGLESRICLDGDLAESLRTAITSMLRRAGVAPERVRAAVGSGFPGVDGLSPEDTVLRELFGDEAVDRVPAADLIGDTSAASALFGLASVLSVAGDGDHAVVTACDDDGSIACALLGLGGGPR